MTTNLTRKLTIAGLAIAGVATSLGAVSIRVPLCGALLNPRHSARKSCGFALR